MFDPALGVQLTAISQVDDCLSFLKIQFPATAASPAGQVWTGSSMSHDELGTNGARVSAKIAASAPFQDIRFAITSKAPVAAAKRPG